MADRRHALQLPTSQLNRTETEQGPRRKPDRLFVEILLQPGQSGIGQGRGPPGNSQQLEPRARRGLFEAKATHRIAGPQHQQIKLTV